MKKVFLAVLAIAAMMVSCQKEGLVDNQKETPEVEVNELQPVVLGSNLFKDPATKASVESIGDWRGEGLPIYVWALNQNAAAEIDYPNPEDPDKISKVFINNVAATLADATETTPDTGNLGSLKLVDSGNKPFYYGTDNADIYDFYAYYLGYSINEDTNTEAKYENGVITVNNVIVNGENDIMAATTDRAADAVVENGSMVNPKYLYSEYSARHGVRPNLVFKHQLSKFTFNVRYGSPLSENSKLELTGVTIKNAFISGTLTLKETPSFEPGEETGDITKQPDPIELTIKTDVDDYGYKSAGNLMVVPAGEGSYTLKIAFKQTFASEDVKEGFLEKTIVPNDVVVNPETGDRATSFDAGKHYVVNITVYGFEEVKVNVQLTEWESAGTVTIDPDAKVDGFMDQLNATITIDEGIKNCTLYAEKFKVADPLYEAYCIFEGENKLVSAPTGTYTVTSTDSDLASVTVMDGKITVVTPKESEPEP